MTDGAVGETVAAATRKPKMKECLVIGLWKSTDGALVFVPAERQPSESITELGKMVAWAKKEFELDGGAFEFVRMVPGKLTLGRQTVLSAEFIR